MPTTGSTCVTDMIMRRMLVLFVAFVCNLFAADGSLCSVTTPSESFPLLASSGWITMLSDSSFAVDGCLTSRTPLLLLASLPVSNVTILVRNCVGVVPRIVFSSEANNIVILMRNVTVTSDDLRNSSAASNTFVSVAHSSANVRISVESLVVVRTLDIAVSCTLMSLYGNSTKVVVDIQHSVLQLLVSEYNPLMLISGSSIASVDVTVVNLTLTTVEEAPYTDIFAVLLQFTDFTSLSDVTVAIADTRIDTDVRTRQWDMSKSVFSVDISIIGFIGRREMPTPSLAWSRIAVTLSNCVIVMQATPSLLEQLLPIQTSVLSQISGVTDFNPDLFPRIDHFSFEVRNSRISMQATVNARVLYVQSYFKELYSTTVRLNGVRFEGTLSGILPRRSTLRSTVAIDVGANITTSIVTVADCHMNLTAPMGNLPVLPSSPDFAMMRAIWDSQESQGSVFANAGVSVANFKKVLSTSLSCEHSCCRLPLRLNRQPGG